MKSSKTIGMLLANKCFKSMVSLKCCSSHLKDSSNDEEIFRDSSNDEGYPHTANSDAAFSTFKGKGLSMEMASTSQISIDSNSLADEAAMMLMSEEEQQYYDHYLQGKQSVTLITNAFMSNHVFLVNQDQISSLKCTTCSCQLFIASPEQLRIHPALGVLICKVFNTFDLKQH